MSVSFTRPLVAAALAAMPAATTGEPSTILLAPVPDERGFAGAFAGVTGHHLIAGGGANFPDGKMPWEGGRKVWHDRLFALDLTAANAKWQEIGHLPAANGYGVSLTVPEGILIIGGGDASRHFRDVFILTRQDDGTPSFRALRPLPEPLAQMCGAVVGRQIHLCGGISTPDATIATAKHWVLDLDAQDRGWQEQPDLPATGRILATAASVDGSFYVMGGCSLADDNGKAKRTYLRDAWKFSSGKWSRIADLPRASVAAASPAPTSVHSFHLVSGDDGTQVGIPSPADHKGFPSDVLRYDTSTDTWKTDGHLSIPAPVTLAVAPWKDGTIFFNGEIRPGVRTTQVFIFHPAP